jgi:hypothetical protein
VVNWLSGGILALQKTKSTKQNKNNYLASNAHNVRKSARRAAASSDSSGGCPRCAAYLRGFQLCQDAGWWTAKCRAARCMEEDTGGEMETGDEQDKKREFDASPQRALGQDTQ